MIPTSSGATRPRRARRKPPSARRVSPTPSTAPTVPTAPKASTRPPPPPVPSVVVSVCLIPPPVSWRPVWVALPVPGSPVLRLTRVLAARARPGERVRHDRSHAAAAEDPRRQRPPGPPLAQHRPHRVRGRPPARRGARGPAVRPLRDEVEGRAGRRRLPRPRAGRAAARDGRLGAGHAGRAAVAGHRRGAGEGALVGRGDPAVPALVVLDPRDHEGLDRAGVHRRVRLRPGPASPTPRTPPWRAGAR